MKVRHFETKFPFIISKFGKVLSYGRRMILGVLFSMLKPVFRKSTIGLFAIALVMLAFQNCSGWVVGNPVRFQKVELKFDQFFSKISDIDVCLTNAYFHLKDANINTKIFPGEVQLPKGTDDGGFDQSYFYAEAKSFDQNGVKVPGHSVVGALKNKPLRLTPHGTNIGTFYLPEGIYDQINVSFSSCESRPEGVRYINNGTEVKDAPYKHTVIANNFKSGVDIHTTGEFAIPVQNFVNALEGITTTDELVSTPEHFRVFRDFSKINFTTPYAGDPNRILEFADLIQSQKNPSVTYFVGMKNVWVFVAKFIDGQIDTDFADGGIYRIVPGFETVPASTFPGIATDKMGNIYVTANARFRNPVTSRNDSNIVVAKLFENGEPDLSFGLNGQGFVIIENPKCSKDCFNNGASIQVLENEIESFIFVAGTSVHGEIITSKLSMKGDILKVRTDDYSPYATSWPLKMIMIGSDVIVATTGKTPSDKLSGEYDYYNFLVHKFDKNLNLLWSNSYDGGSNYFDRFEDIAIQDNRIILSGSVPNIEPHAPHKTRAVAFRINESGELDTTFGINGRVAFQYIKESSFNGIGLTSSGLTLTGTIEDFSVSDLYHYFTFKLDKNGKYEEVGDPMVNPYFYDTILNVFFSNVSARGGDLLVQNDGSTLIGGARDSHLHLLKAH